MALRISAVVQTGNDDRVMKTMMILDKSCQLQQNAGDRDRQTVAPNIYCDSQGGKQKKIRFGNEAPPRQRIRERDAEAVEGGGEWRRGIHLVAD